MEDVDVFARMLAKFGITYENEANKNGCNHLCSAFLNGYHTAISHALNILTGECVDDLATFLNLAEDAFHLLDSKAGVEPSKFAVTLTIPNAD